MSADCIAPRDACDECLSRGLLLRALAGHIDRSVDGRIGDRARDVLALSSAELAAAVCPGNAAAMLRRSRSHSAHDELRRELGRLGCWSTCAHRDGFPAGLTDLGDAAPAALFGAGEPSRLEELRSAATVSIVGSRRCGAYGREVAADLARLLSAGGIGVISGLALGIDSAAHEGALDGGGLTVAILGTGAERPYPRSRRRLYERIVSTGLVLSELPPGSPTFRWMFPARNRLMATMAGVTVVVEAAERSGSLITAEMALEAGRQVGAVPGPVTSWRSAGTNRLLADGAAVVRDAQDVLDLLLGPGAVSVVRRGPAVDAADLPVLDAVEAGATTPDAAAVAAGLDFAAALKALGRLERDGYVSADPTGGLIRTSQPIGEDGPRGVSTIGG